MNLILFDSTRDRTAFLPLTYTRPLAAMRIGILTIAEKWEKELELESTGFLTVPYLTEKFPANYGSDNLYVAGNLLPSNQVTGAVALLPTGGALWHQGILLAVHSEQQFASFEELEQFAKDTAERSELGVEPWRLEERWQLFTDNAKAIEADFDVVTKGRESQPITDPHTVVYGDRIFVEEGASIRAAILNSESGAIYIGKNATVHEGAIIKGAFALCESSHINMAAKIKGDTTVGPHSKVGGEVSNSVIFGYSNKGHDGFMGNSVMGEWCNLGADTNTSNLKNNYGAVKLWDYASGSPQDTGQQFCGSIIGDHSKTGINSMMNTGTIMGVCANVFGGDFQKQFVPSFAWGNRRYATFKLEKAFEVAEKVMARRKVAFDEVEKRIMEAVFEETAKYRK